MTSSSTFFLNLSFSLLSPLTTQKIINARIRKLIIAERKLPIFIDVPGIIHLDISITDSTALVSPTVLVAAVTVRDRDTMEQQRIKIDELEKFLEGKLEF